ncbi:hypothetical protein [Salisediminibacterium beveridgei]|nr:hypothetical protein [Salisediminibacterium beveridgei]
MCTQLLLGLVAHASYMLSGGFFRKEELLFFGRLVQVGKRSYVASTNQKQ